MCDQKVFKDYALATIFEIMYAWGVRTGSSPTMYQEKNKLCIVHEIGCYLVIRTSKLLLYIT